MIGFHLPFNLFESLLDRVTLKLGFVRRRHSA